MSEDLKFSGSPKGKGKKGKGKDKDKGYMERQSSEEESLVQGEPSGSTKKTKKRPVFKLPTAANKKNSDSSNPAFVKSKKKSLKKVGKVKDSGDKKDVLVHEVFGVQLEEAVRLSPCCDNVPVPAFLRRAMDHVTENLKTEGIYRISAPMSAMKDFQRKIEEDPSAELVFPDPHHASGLVKLFFGKLPEPLLSNDLQDYLVKILSDPKKYMTDMDDWTVDEFLAHELRMRLTLERFITLAYVLLHANRVLEFSDSNKMSFKNMGLMLWQTLRINEQKLLSYLLEHSKTLFSDVTIKPYDPTSVDTDNFPGSKFALQEALAEQEARLAALHEEVHHSAENITPEEQQKLQQQLWDVQRAVTQLRRKLKSLSVNADKTEASGDDKVDASTGPTLEMFEEKQLWALHMELRQKIEEERIRIQAASRELAELIAQDGDQRAESTDSEWDHSEQENQNHDPSASDPERADPSKQNGALPHPPDDANGDVDYEKMELELKKEYEKLIEKKIDENEKTAHAKAELEMLTVDENVDDVVVVTRF